MEVKISLYFVFHQNPWRLVLRGFRWRIKFLCILFYIKIPGGMSRGDLDGRQKFFMFHFSSKFLAACPEGIEMESEIS